MRSLRLRVAAVTNESVTLEPVHDFALQKGFGSITFSPLTNPRWCDLTVGDVMEFDQSDEPLRAAC